MPYDEKIVARFWAKVPRCEHGETCETCCWEWQGARGKNGYGNFYISRFDNRVIHARAHCVAWELAHQEFISLDLWCLHRCDNPPCCNPRHLFLGTQQDNVDDMRRKGREARGDRHGLRKHPEAVKRGEQSHYAKLTTRQVLEIRELAATGQHHRADLASRYGVSVSAILDAVTGRNWAHLPGACRPKWPPRSAPPHLPMGHPLRGEKNHHAKLTTLLVREIRQRYARGDGSFRALGSQYGVSWQVVQRIVHRRTWAHVAEADEEEVRATDAWCRGQ
jgi:hypothetical protein